MKLSILGSSSTGNSYLLHSKDECLIVEAGIKFIEAKKALDYNVSIIKGVLVSHSHLDHAKYIKSYLEAGITVYSSSDTFTSLGIKNHNTVSVLNGEAYKIGNFKVRPVEIVHDVKCFGFMINHFELGNTVFITDTHYIPYTFKGMNNLIIECNYDENILESNIQSDSIPLIVRNRVLSSHMSLQTLKEMLKKNDLSCINNIVLVHLSSGNANANQFKKEIEDLTGKSVWIAKKGMEIEFNKEAF